MNENEMMHKIFFRIDSLIEEAIRDDDFPIQITFTPFALQRFEDIALYIKEKHYEIYFKPEIRCYAIYSTKEMDTQNECTGISIVG